MTGILKTQRAINAAQQRADELRQEAKQLKRAIREGSGRLKAQSERLCGQVVLHLLRQGTPASQEAIVAQARVMASGREQEALDLLLEQLRDIPRPDTRSEQITQDPNIKFLLGETLTQTSICEPAEYKEAAASSIKVTDAFFASSPETLREHLIRVIAEEGPISYGMVYTRVRKIWGLAQAVPAMKDAIKSHLTALRDGGHIAGDQESFWPIDHKTVPRRRSKSFREIYGSELIPKVELRAAIVQRLIRVPSTKHEITASVAEQLSYELKSQGLKARIEDEIAQMYKAGDIVAKRL
ncbi:hypothetical protein AO398_26855 [Methylobacterium sp. GXS13]|uniref:DUF3320 domain-containing protein n=1 Tax=Methylobacterium sp. GXS13 TaxID=1730094 RepID=UPI00071BB8BD|nr:DUF3320 domain-containing protein [Methylobacterium sp. GXS13]KST56740.1 hypothetical protein AO398_26855 [Methylobacterium sp. GXS13]